LREEGREERVEMGEGVAMDFCVCIFLKSDRSVNLTTMMMMMMMMMTRNDESDVM
jgi:hypothetical protein